MGIAFEKVNGRYQYTGPIEGYDEARIPPEGDWTQGIYTQTYGTFYVDDLTKLPDFDNEKITDFPTNGKSVTEWLDYFYANKKYWMALGVIVKGNHVEKITGICSIC